MGTSTSVYMLSSEDENSVKMLYPLDLDMGGR